MFVGGKRREPLKSSCVKISSSEESYETKKEEDESHPMEGRKDGWMGEGGAGPGVGCFFFHHQVNLRKGGRL